MEVLVFMITKVVGCLEKVFLDAEPEGCGSKRFQRL